MTRIITVAALALMATPLWAAGGGSFTPPPTTETSSTCEDGQIWDKDTQACVDAQESRFDDRQRLDAVRELAYADRPEAALMVLAAMGDQNADMVLTYKGFAHRKAGDWELGMDYYRQAIQQNPDNIMARSYMGQALVQRGQVEAARAELREIQARGERETWAAFSLRSALSGGQGLSY